jgi:hypothetical protein
LTETIPLKISETGDYCELGYDVNENSKEFGRFLITFGFANTKAFAKESRDDDNKVIHGEGYTFYLWYKEEVLEYYKTDEYKAIEARHKDNITDNADNEDNGEETESGTYRTREETYEVVEGLKNSVYEHMQQDVFKPAQTEPVFDGFMFKISEETNSIDIDFDLLNTHYLDHCDALYESLFNIIEKIFKFEITDKEVLQVKDVIEDGKTYCVSSVYFRLDNHEKKARLMNEDITPMKDIKFSKARVNQVKKIDRDLEYTTFPIRNLKVYFEKTQRVNEFGEALSKGTPEHHMYYTMNFHLFFTNSYGPNQGLEEKMIEQVVDEMEAIYCLNFECEPDLDSQTQLNFTYRNEEISPEHYMIVNYFKPSFMFEHMIQNAEDDEEVREEDQEAEKLMHVEEGGGGEKRRLVLM